MAKTVYELRVMGDVEGRTTKVAGYFTRREDAEALVQRTPNNYGYGTSAKNAVREIEVYTSLEDFIARTPDNISLEMATQILGKEDRALKMLRRRVINSFTAEQRLILGLTEET